MIQFEKLYKHLFWKKKLPPSQEVLNSFYLGNRSYISRHKCDLPFSEFPVFFKDGKNTYGDFRVILKWTWVFLAPGIWRQWQFFCEISLLLVLYSIILILHFGHILRKYGKSKFTMKFTELSSALPIIFYDDVPYWGT